MKYLMTFENSISENFIKNKINEILDLLLSGKIEVGGHVSSNLLNIKMRNKSRELYLNRFNNIEIENNKMIIYRAIQFDKRIIKLENLKIEKLGKYWSWLEHEAFPYHSLKLSKYYYVYKAKINIHNINWLETVIKSLDTYGGEHEIELKENITLNICEIIEKKDTDKYLIKKYDVNYLAKS